MDIYSRMYTSVEQTIELANKISKPLILCDYIHAMGKGPGGIKEYVETFFTYPISRAALYGSGQTMVC